MAWTLQAMGHPKGGETRKWKGALSSRIIPHGVLACRAAVLNLLADGVEADIRAWDAVGAITYSRASTKPITVAYADVVVPASIEPITDDSVRNRTVFDLLVKMRDPGRAIAELEALAHQGQIGRGAISTLLSLSRRRPTPSLDQLIAELHSYRIL